MRSERRGKAPSSPALTPEQRQIQALEKQVRRLEMEKQILKGYSPLDVELAEQFALVERLKESYPIKRLCETFGIYRSSYRAWQSRPTGLKPEERQLRERIKEAHQLSNGSAGARTIASLVMAEGLP